jgi:hypothetical protein
MKIAKAIDLLGKDADNKSRVPLGRLNVKMQSVVPMGLNKFYSAIRQR